MVVSLSLGNGSSQKARKLRQQKPLLFSQSKLFEGGEARVIEGIFHSDVIVMSN